MQQIHSSSSIAWRSAPVEESHTLQVPAKEPAASMLPSGERAALKSESWCPTILNRKAPVAASNKSTFATQWPPAVAMVRPSGEGTANLSPSTLLIIAPLLMSHCFKVLSYPELASLRPSVGANCTHVTRDPCASGIARSNAPVIASHTRMDPPSLALASRAPSAENETDVTQSVSFSNISSAFPVWASHRITVKAPPPVASVCPHGENATALNPEVCACTGHPSSSDVRRPLLVTLQTHAPVPSCLAPVTHTSPFAPSQSFQLSSDTPTLAKNLPSGDIAT
mmetsp:Transcript_55859/g.133316  ORF Transcript_55859/g.133316 Transcript_55859/m.133316 type:complete len:282 (-) Transcript_55859:164-1009(-)